MATADKKSLFVGGGNGAPISPTGNAVTDLERAQDVARRYRCEFIDLTDFALHQFRFSSMGCPCALQVEADATTAQRAAAAVQA